MRASSVLLNAGIVADVLTAGRLDRLGADNRRDLFFEVHHLPKCALRLAMSRGAALRREGSRWLRCYSDRRGPSSLQRLAVLSGLLASQSASERQEHIWKHLDAHLTPFERTRIVFIVTDTPDEYKGAQGPRQATRFRRSLR